MTASSAAAATSSPGPYIGALSVHDLFVDRSYQRPLDLPRARRLAETWEPPLIGVIEASDRGPDHQPRYAIIDGQHRYAAAKLRIQTLCWSPTFTPDSPNAPRPTCSMKSTPNAPG